MGRKSPLPGSPGPVRAILYERVSSAEQKKGFSLHAQHHDLKVYCERQGYQVVRAYRESGSRRDMSREALVRLLELADRRVFDVVVVWRRDRFGAGDDVKDVEKFLRERGVRIEAMMQGPQPNNSITRFNNRVMDAVADLEVDTINERCMGGRLQAAREGKYPLKPPVGWTRTYPDMAIVVDDVKAHEIRAIFEAVVAGKRLRDISGRRGEKYHNTLLYRLHNPAYKGETSYCGIPVKLPPIVTPELWERAQQVLLERKRRGKRGGPLPGGSPPVPDRVGPTSLPSGPLS